MEARHAEAAPPYAALDREIVLSKVFDAPRELVFRAWTEREHFARWFGPRGYSIVMHEHDARVGGRIRFDMIGPDGTRYTNRMAFLEITRAERLVFDHGVDQDEDAHKFRVTVTFDAQSDGKTVVTLRQLHPTKAQRDAGIGFGAVELGYQTLDKLAAHLREL
jgi:uncharacterized protein YndB with AHSA1/START domain